MSRSCMYCGRELERGEKCSCPQSVKMRAERQGANNTSASENSQNFTTNNTASNTKSTSDFEKNKKSKFEFSNAKESGEKAKKSKPKKERKFHFKGNSSVQKNNKEFLTYITSCLRQPIYKASNPGYPQKWWIWFLIGIQGLVISAAIFLSTSAMKKGIIGILSMALGFQGVNGWKNMLQLLASMISGIALGYLQFFVLCGILYLIGKIVFRSSSSYWEYAERLTPCSVPLTLIGLLGTLLAVFSPAVLFIAIACGIIIEIIMIYEAMRVHWNVTPDFLVYTLASGLFLYAVVCYNIYKLIVQ